MPGPLPALLGLASFRGVLAPVYDLGMMLGHERWKTDLGGDSSIVGQPMRFYDGHTFTVVGVLPPDFTFTVSPFFLPSNAAPSAVL